MNKTAANFVYFSSAVVIVKVLGAVTTFAVAKFMAPADYGVWVTLLIIGSYSSILCFGTVEALVKLYPYYTGKNEFQKAGEVESGVLGSIFLAALLLVAAGFAVPLLARTPVITSLRPVIWLVVFAAALGVFSAFYYYRFTAHQDFKSVSFIDALRSVTIFILIVPLTWLWGLMGAAIATLIDELVILWYSYSVNKRSLGGVKVGFKAETLRTLIAVGFPITIIWWTYMFLTSVDRLLSMALLGKSATGYYGLGVSIVSSLVLIPMVLGRILYPKVNEEIGKNTDPARLKLYVIVPAQALGLILPLLIGTLVIVTPDIYRLFFPKYLPGIFSAQILMLGAYFICLVRTGVNYLVAIDKQNNVLGMVMLSLMVNVALSVVLVKMGLNIEGISLGTAVSGLVLSTVLWKSVFKNLGYTAAAQYRELFFLYQPFFIGAMLLGGFFGVSRAAPGFDAPVPHLLAALLFIVLYGGALFFIPPLNSWNRDLINRVKHTMLPVRAA
ncbi:MAG: polysaccharide biosynthesis C-terminal domain-containing protein [Chitinivibrionales bacterium]|nr:polysaccharide biosynthesis C-terminal domain-containing protein [Chitinivibrionales bacterium]